MKRLGALVVAVALIAGAILANRAIHDDDSPSDDDSPAAKVRVTCATEFAAACKTLDADVTVEAPGRTVAALVADPTPTFDLWITSEPWPELAAVRAGRPVGLGESTRLAASPLGAVTTAQRATEFAAACGGDVAGKCLLTTARRLGLRSTNETSTLLTFAAMLSGWDDLPPAPDLGTTDLEVADAFNTAFARAKAEAQENTSPIRAMLTQRLFDVALDLNAFSQLDVAANKAEFKQLRLAPIVAVAVAVEADTATGRGATERIGRSAIISAITATGWSDTIPDTPPLPDPAVLDYLASKWNNQ